MERTNLIAFTLRHTSHSGEAVSVVEMPLSEKELGWLIGGVFRVCLPWFGLWLGVIPIVKGWQWEA